MSQCDAITLDIWSHCILNYSVFIVHTSVIVVSVWSLYGWWTKSGSHLLRGTGCFLLSWSLNFGIEHLQEDWFDTLQGWNNNYLLINGMLLNQTPRMTILDLLLLPIIPILQDSLDQCPMPINAYQNSGIDPNVDQSAMIGIDSISDQCHDFDRHWSALGIDRGSPARWGW